MQYATYREEMNKLDIKISSKNNDGHVSNYIKLMFELMRNIALKFSRPKGYVSHIAKNKNPLIAIDVMLALLDIMKDNEINVSTEIIKDYELLMKYIILINENLDNPIRDNPCIIYDESEDCDPLLNNDMFAEAFQLVSNLNGEIIKDCQ